MTDVTADTAASTTEPALRLTDLRKSFGANAVLKGVDLALTPGRVTALLGANGAGKSTLIKILAGAYQPTSGELEVGGEKVEFATPLDAARAGVRTVHQRVDDAIVPGLTVAENLLFERIAEGKDRISSLRSLLPKARAIADVLNLGWSDAVLRSDAYDLGIADCQMLLLARALVTTPRVLILDEPTSTLSNDEVDRLFALVRKLRDQGVAILYVSHRMGEIRTLADDIAVLRDGKVVNRQEAPFALDQAITAMLGEAISADAEDHGTLEGGTTALTIQGTRLFTESAPLDLELKYGQVTGIIGLIGAGKTELMERIFGAGTVPTPGVLTLDGASFDPSHPKEAIARGVYLVPEDRAAQGMLPGWSIARTLSLPFLKRISRGGILESRRETTIAARAIEDFGIVSTGPAQAVDALSGGNQQKVMVSRWMQVAPKVLLLDEPFRGVDIGARREITRRASMQAREGACVVVVTSDVEELREAADRILVMVEGRIVLDGMSADLTNEQIIASMSEVA